MIEDRRQAYEGALFWDIVHDVTNWYTNVMIRAYEEIVDFIAAGTSPMSVAKFEASEATKQRVAELIHREKTTGLSAEEAAELDHYMQVEHLMRLAKARARQHLGHE